jgi:hypothetical protein
MPKSLHTRIYRSDVCFGQNLCRKTKHIFFLPSELCKANSRSACLEIHCSLWNPTFDYPAHMPSPLVPIETTVSRSIYLRSTLMWFSRPRLGLPMGLFPSVFSDVPSKRWSVVSCHYSDGLQAGRTGFDSRKRQNIFLYSTASRAALGPTQLPIQWVPGG